MKRWILFCGLVCSFLQAGANTILEGVFREKDSAATNILLQEMVMAGSLAAPLSIKKDITGKDTFMVTMDIKQPGFFQLFIIRGEGNAKFSYNIPVYLEPGKTVRLAFYADGPRRLRCDTSGGLDAVNRSLIAQQEKYLQLLIDWWKQPQPGEGAAQTYLHQFDLVADTILQHPALTPAARKFIRFRAVDAYTTGLYQLYPGKSAGDAAFPGVFFKLENDKVKYYHDPFMTMFQGYLLNIINQLNIATGLRPFAGKKSLDQINTQIQLLKKQTKAARITDPVIELLLTSYITRYSVGDNFAADRSRFERLASAIVNTDTRTAMLRTFKNLQYTVKGAVLPPVPLKDKAGRAVSLEQFKGKYLVIDMWASWCVPCCKMVPVYQQLEKLYEGKPVNFISISVDTDNSKWMARMEELNMHGHQYLDAAGTFMKYLNISAIPHYLLYGPDGRLLHYKMGSPDSASFKEMLDQAIK